MIAAENELNKWWLALFTALLCLPALAAFNPSGLYFLNDDFIHIPLSQAATWGQRNSIRPVGDFSLYVDGLLWGNNAVGYHISNMLIHVVNSVLVYFLTTLLLPQLAVQRHKRTYAVAVALLFFSYAFHAESVFWIIGRSASLSAIFFNLSLIIFLSGRRSYLWIIVSLILFFIALLTYESVWVLPLMMLLLIWRNKQFKNTRALVLVVGFCVLLGVYLFLRVQWTGEVAGQYETSAFQQFDAGKLLTNFIKLVARTFVAPQKDSTSFILSCIFFVLIMAVLAWFAINKKTKVNWFLWIVLWLLSYIPYLSLGIDTHGVESERYLYLPSIFSSLLLVAFIAHFKKFRWSIAVFCCYLFYHVYFLHKEAKAFRVASFISQATIEAVQQNREKQHYYFENLPQENYGVPIFRLGLKEGLDWLVEKNAADKIRLLSIDNRERMIWTKPRKEVKFFQVPRHISSYMEPAQRSSDAYVSILDSVSIDHEQLLLYYTDSVIAIYR